MTGNTVYVLLKGEVDNLHQELDDAIVGVFTPGGSLEFSELPTLSADVLGMVYTVTDDFTTDSRFVEGAGKDYPAGTNVAVVNTGTNESPVYKFDAKTSVIAVDDELSITSENPVQNKVITAALNAIELPDEITVSEAHDDFEAVFGSGTTGNPNLLTANASVFDSSDVTIVDP